LVKNVADDLKSFLATVAWCLSLSWKTSKFYTIIRMVADIAMPLLSITSAFIAKYLLDMLAGDLVVEDTQFTLLLLFAGLLTIALIVMISQNVAQYSQSMQDDMISREISLDMMQRTLVADLEFFDNPNYYDRLQSASQDAMAVSSILWNALSCISACVSFIGAFAVLYQSNPVYGLMMIGAAVPASIMSARYTKLLYMLSLDQVNEHRQMYYCQFLASDRAYAKDIRLFNAGARLKKRYKLIWRTLFNQKKIMTRKRFVMTGFLGILPEIVVVLIGIDIAFGVMNGINTVGDYALFTVMAGQLWGSINMFSNASLHIYDDKLKIENIKRLDAFQSRISDDSSESLTEIRSIVFDQVSFTYPGSTMSALSNISFALHKDEKIALVGLNGSGKSTLIKLLLRMYDPDSGVIRINNIDIRKYKLCDLRINFSVYFQETPNYNFTLSENFTIADHSWTDGEIKPQATEALKAVYGADILEKAQKGFNTSLTRQFDLDGMELSGGQHQKIALARTLYRKHTALILGEPSSNLDPKAEHEIFKSLKLLTKGKMTIFTSHRLSNVALADRILVLEKGKLVEDGTQDELLKNKQRYAELFKYQQEKYI